MAITYKTVLAEAVRGYNNIQKALAVNASVTGTGMSDPTLTNNTVGNLSTASQMVTAIGKLTTLATLTASGTASATTTVAPGTVSIAANTTSVSGKTRLAITPTTSDTGISTYYIAVKATAAENNTGSTSSITGTATAGVGSTGFAYSTLTGSGNVTGTATAKTSKKDSLVYYLPIPTGGCTASGGGLSKGTASGGGLSGGGLSVTTNYSGTPTVDISLDGQTTSGVTITDTKPTSGYYLTIGASSSKLTGSTKVSRAAVTRAAFSQTVSKAAVTATHTAGYMPAGSSTISSSGSETVTLAADSTTIGATSASPSVTVNSGSKTEYIVLPEGGCSPSASLANLSSAASGATSVTSRYFKVTPSAAHSAGYIGEGNVSGTATNYTVRAASVTQPAETQTGASASLSGTILTLSKSVTPSVETSGWIDTATAGTVSLSGTVPTETKTGITPTTSSQTITPSSGKLLSSVQINAIQTETKTASAAGDITPSSGKYLTKVSVPAGTISTGDTKQSSYIENKDAVVPANGYLYIGAGWYPNTQISLSTIIPDDSSKTNAGTGQIRQDYEAYSTTGEKLIGTMPDWTPPSTYYTDTNTGYGAITGYSYVNSVTKYIKSGSISGLTDTVTGITPSVSVSGSTATVSLTGNVTASVSSGWVDSGKTESVTMTGTLPTATPAFDGGTITPPTPSLTLSKGTDTDGTGNIISYVTDRGTTEPSNPTNYVYFPIKADAGQTTATRSAVLYNGAVNGWVSAADNATALASTTITTSNAKSSTEYFSIPKATPAFDGGGLSGGGLTVPNSSVTLAKGDTDGTGNITSSITDKGTTEPTSGYYIAISGTAAAITATRAAVTRAAVKYNGAVNGWVSVANDTDALSSGSLGSTTKSNTATTATEYFTIPTGGCTVSGGGLTKGSGSVSTTGNISLTEVSSAPASGYYITSTGSGTVNRAAITDTHTAGYIPAKSATTVSAATSLASNTATKYYTIPTAVITNGFVTAAGYIPDDDTAAYKTQYNSTDDCVDILFN